MSEELESKLNELLGMKKQLEELTTEKRKNDALVTFAGKKKKLLIYYWIYLAIFVVIAMGGIIGIETETGSEQIYCLFVALLGCEGAILIKMWYHTTNSRLLILDEMKQFEIRMTALLEKQAGQVPN
jgi:hypothetical protein